MSQSRPKNIAIVGGSLGGLLTGVALKRLNKGLNIRIFERSPTPLLQDQGAGVVAGAHVQKFFDSYDKTRTPLTIQSQCRLYLDRNGKVIDREDKKQQMTSWDLLYHLLRTNFDGIQTTYAKVPEDDDKEGKTSYEYGCTVTKVEPPCPSNMGLDFSRTVKITIQKSDGETKTEEADIVIAADGPSSSIRAQYFPDVKRTYAGYVAWRGTVPETEVPQNVAEPFIERFTFFHTEGIQILAYTIPGKHGTIQPDHRLINWVWYVNYKEGSSEHVEVMTDEKGKRHHVTLPPGAIKEDIWKKQKSAARENLPPQFAELVNKTEVPLVQAITDVIAPSAVQSGGRVLLVGDALAGFRPHTAASTNQAALNAIGVSKALGKIIDGGGFQALEQWEEEVMEYARTLQRGGVTMGDRSQFGRHPLSG